LSESLFLPLFKMDSFLVVVVLMVSLELVSIVTEGGCLMWLLSMANVLVAPKKITF